MLQGFKKLFKNEMYEGVIIHHLLECIFVFSSAFFKSCQHCV